MGTKIKPTRIKSNANPSEGDKLGYLNPSNFGWNKGSLTYWCTQYEYSQLPDDKLTDGIAYFIIPASSTGTVVNIQKLIRNGKEYVIPGGGAPMNKFLSLWDCVDGEPMSFPESTPYEYATGDWYLVDNVAGEGETNLRPEGDEYNDGDVSTTPETLGVQVGDVYIYDGTIWLLQQNHQEEVSFGNLTGQPEDNNELADRLDSKVNKVSGTNKVYGTSSTGSQASYDLSDSATADTVVKRTASGTVRTATPTNANDATTKQYVDNLISTAGQVDDVKVDGTSVVDANKVANIDLSGKQDTLTAGHNITISGTTINAVDELPTLGEAGEVLTVTGGIDVWGPMEEGYHIPTKDEWVAVVNAGVTIGAWTSDGGDDFRIKMKIPFAGYRSNSSSTVTNQGSYADYWSSTASNANNAYNLGADSSTLKPQSGSSRARGCSIRCFKNTPVIPDSTWTVITQGTGTAGIYHNATLGLISISSDGTTWYTLQDKNLGATTVYNNGDTLSQANCGNYYQRGNCYGFPRTGTVTTSSAQVDASGYGKGNLYSSDTYIKYLGDWSSVQNDNLRGTIISPIQASWESPEKELPSGGTAGQVLTKTADGTAWQNVDSLPTQTGNNGKFLQTNGTAASWQETAIFCKEDEYPSSSYIQGVTYFIYEEES